METVRGIERDNRKTARDKERAHSCLILGEDKSNGRQRERESDRKSVPCLLWGDEKRNVRQRETDREKERAKTHLQ